MRQNENVCNWSSHWETPHLSPFHFFRGHDDDSSVLLKHHPPEVTDGVLQAALRGDVAPLQFGIVALSLDFRLEITKKKVTTQTFSITLIGLEGTFITMMMLALM